MFKKWYNINIGNKINESFMNNSYSDTVFDTFDKEIEIIHNDYANNTSGSQVERSQELNNYTFQEVRTPESLAIKVEDIKTPSTEKVSILSIKDLQKEALPSSPIIKKADKVYSAKERPSSREYRKKYEMEVGPIEDGYEIHHLDHCSRNSEITNLVAIPQKLHTLIHQIYLSVEKLRRCDEKFMSNYQKFMNGSRDKRVRKTIKRTWRNILLLQKAKKSLRYYIDKRDRQIQQKSMGRNIF